MDHSPRFLKLVQESKACVQECTVQQAWDRIQQNPQIHFVDVREESEFAEGHAKGAIHIGKGVLERDIEKRIPNTEDQIILYCGGGFRSAISAELLGRMGYRNVVSMDGGMRGWKAAGLPMAD